MTNVNEVAPPGWGHTKAEKEKTKPNKPKSKIGGSAHEFDKDLKSGKFKGLPGDKTMKDKKASMFKLMWSMKNKGDKPHYKPGVKDVLKKKYQKEEKVDEKPYPPTRLFKNVPNSVVKKANKEADKVKKEQEKAVLGEPPVRGPSGDSMHSKDNVYEDEKVDMVSLVAQAIKKEGTEGDALVKAVANSPKQQALKKKQMLSITSAGKKAVKKGDHKLSITAKGRAAVKEGAKELEARNAAKADKKQQGGSLKHKVWPASASMKMPKEDMSLAPKGKGRKAAKALYKEWGDTGPLHKQRARHAGRPDIPKKKEKKEEVTHFGDILRQAIEEAKKVDAIKEINKIVKTKTMGKLHGQKVDLFTASAIQQVYKAINHKNKEKMNSVMSKDIHGLLKMADFSMSKMKR